LEDIKCYLSRILGERRISQRALAKVTGLSTATVNKIYNETWARIDRATILQLCKALGVQVGELFEYVETESAIKGKSKRK
jgi:putative transcriptional regulator